MTSEFLVGSNYFFKDIEGFKSKDIDKLILVDEPVGFKFTRQTTGLGKCIFEWKRMTADEFVEITLKTKCPMIVGKFLIPEFCQEIGFTIEHLKQLKPLFDAIDIKHRYEKYIFDAYLINNDFVLTPEQKKIIYEEYKKRRLDYVK